MPQEFVAPEIWEVPRETVELIPLTVTLGGSATTAYSVCVVIDNGTRPSAFVAPSIAEDQLGYLINGPTLVASAGGYKNFRGFVKVDGDDEDPVVESFHIRLT